MREELGYRLRMIKICAGSASIEGDNDFDWTVEQMQYGNPAADVDSFMTGAQYEIKNSNIDDELCFQVAHPQLGVVDQFACIAAIDGSHLFDQYLAELPAGLIIRLKYTRVGSNIAEIKCNLMRHIYNHSFKANGG